MKISIYILFGWCIILTALCNMNYYFIKNGFKDKNQPEVEKVIILTTDHVVKKDVIEDFGVRDTLISEGIPIIILP